MYYLEILERYFKNNIIVWFFDNLIVKCKKWINVLNNCYFLLYVILRFSIKLNDM